MVTVVVHQMVPVASELVAQLFHDTPHLLLGKICAANLNALPARETRSRVSTVVLLSPACQACRVPKPKLITELVVIAGRYFEHAGKRKRMATVGKLRPEHFHPGVEHTEPDRGGVLVDPVLQRRR